VRDGKGLGESWVNKPEEGRGVVLMCRRWSIGKSWTTRFDIERKRGMGAERYGPIQQACFDISMQLGGAYERVYEAPAGTNNLMKAFISSSFSMVQHC
jgi:hypothetical protein